MKTWITLTFGVLLIFAFALARAEVRVSISGGEKIESASNVQVKIPFDQEYRVNLDNKDFNRRALVHVKIDGRAATGDGLILRKGESVQLERFIDNGDLRRGPKFKFVDKDERDRMGRKGTERDSLIAVTVQYEKDKEPIVAYGQITWAVSGSGPITYVPQSNCLMNHSGYYWTNCPTTAGTTTDRTTSASILTSGTLTHSSPSEVEPGITVEGSESKQRFQKTETGELEDRIETLVIRLLGYYKDKPLLMRSR